MLEILDCSMLTPLGNAKQTFAAVNAGINVYQNSTFLNRNKHPMTMCEVPVAALSPVSDELQSLNLSLRRERIIRLAGRPLSELIEANELVSPVPVLFTAPEKIPGLRTPIDDRYFKLILQSHESLIDFENSYVFPYGRASIAMALQTALELLQGGICEFVIVGGADSFVDLNYLEHLDIEERILAPGVTDGFAPGEGASFLLLRLASPDSKMSISAWSSGVELGHRYSEEPYTGEALSGAVTQALSSLAPLRVDQIYANLNGESFFSKEWGITQLRNRKYFSDTALIEHPADCFGDLGAAFGPVMITLAKMHLDERPAASSTLVCASSELETRSAVVLSRG